MNVQPLGFLDTSRFTAAFVLKHRVAMTPLTESLDTLPLRKGDEDLPILAEWKSAKALLTRIRTAAAPYFDNQTPDLGDAAVMSMRPGGALDWSVEEGEYAESHRLLHLCLIPAPGLWVYSNGEAAVLPVGQLTFVNRRALHSVVNFGEHTGVHLVVDVKAPAAPAET